MNGRAGFPGLPGHDDRPLTLHPDELAGEAVSAPELRDALEAARLLESAASAPSVRPSPDFADRVIARLADEPAPGPVGYLVPVRRLGLAGIVASVRQAWAFVGRGSRPFAVRATALAYVLAVVVAGTSLTGLAAYGFAGAVGLLGPDRTSVPTSPAESPGPIVEPSPTREPSPSPSPTIGPTFQPTVEPSPTVPESEEPPQSGEGGSTPRATPHETEDDDDDEEHESDSPDATRTPKPSETPSSSEDDD